MNVKEYINSGIVESYVLGLATDAERSEFEQQCAAYPEVLEARDAFERSLEEQLMKDAVAPPAFVKEKVMASIGTATSETVSPYNDEKETPVRRMNIWKLMAAACFIGLLAVGYWAYNSNEKYKGLEARQSAIEKELAQKSVELDSFNAQARVMRDPDVKMVKMVGTPIAPQAVTTVFWDSTKKDVYLFVNNLPQPASDKQYQLWALLDGKPIDLGMLEIKENSLLVRMKNVQNAQAFAISLEEKGGSRKDVPEGGIYVLGNL